MREASAYLMFDDLPWRGRRGLQGACILLTQDRPPRAGEVVVIMGLPLGVPPEVRAVSTNGDWMLGVCRRSWRGLRVYAWCSSAVGGSWSREPLPLDAEGVRFRPVTGRLRLLGERVRPRPQEGAGV